VSTQAPNQCVKLGKAQIPATTVTVCLRFAEGPAQGGAHSLYRTRLEVPPALEAEPDCLTAFRTSKAHCTSCIGSAFSGVETFAAYHALPGPCLLVAIKGTKLGIDAGVGFSLAAHIAAARALGADARIQDMHGWIEKQL
jgi:hypothetical protein